MKTSVDIELLMRKGCAGVPAFDVRELQRGARDRSRPPLSTSRLPRLTICQLLLLDLATTPTTAPPTTTTTLTTTAVERVLRLDNGLFVVAQRSGWDLALVNIATT